MKNVFPIGAKATHIPSCYCSLMKMVQAFFADIGLHFIGVANIPSLKDIFCQQYCNPMCHIMRQLQEIDVDRQVEI